MIYFDKQQEALSFFIHIKMLFCEFLLIYFSIIFQYFSFNFILSSFYCISIHILTILCYNEFINQKEDSAMIPAVRQEKILAILSSNEIVSIDHIIEELEVSVSTLRRDLTKLEQENKIVLLHGGGVKLSEKRGELSISTKLELNKEAKITIARKAASLVEDGDVIFLDPSSTTYLMIPYLVRKKITVLTNGISHINELLLRDISCLMIGGTIKKTTNSCIGPIAETTMQSLYFNKCFLGASGFSIQSGITNHDINERVIKSLALNNSKQPYFLLDSSKFGAIAMIKVANLEDYPVLIEKLPPELASYSNFVLCSE